MTFEIGAEIMLLRSMITAIHDSNDKMVSTALNLKHSVLILSSWP